MSADVQIRLFEPRDLDRTVQIRLSAAEDLFARLSLPLASPSPAVIASRNQHMASTGCFLVAERGREVVGFTTGTVRGPIWFLTGLWIDTAHQGRGIGKRLLAECHHAGHKAGATINATVSSPDLSGRASYMRLGMLPGHPVLKFVLPADAQRTLPRDVEPEPLTIQDAALIDREVRGAGREVDHAYWLTLGGTARRVSVRGELAGYFYVLGSSVGACGWLRAEDGESVLHAALAHTAGEVRMSVPGVNHTAIRVMLQARARLEGDSLFLTSAPFGRLSQYIPIDMSSF